MKVVKSKKWGYSYWTQVHRCLHLQTHSWKGHNKIMLKHCLFVCVCM